MKSVGSREERDNRTRYGRQALMAAAIAAFATLLVVGLPFLRFAYRDRAAHLVIDTSVALISLLVAYLIFGRYREKRALHDATLAYALLTFGIANLAFATLSETFLDGLGESFFAWCLVVTRLVAAAVFMASAFIPERKVHTPSGTVLLILTSLTLVTIVLLFFIVGDRLPPVVEDPPDPQSSGHVHIEGHPIAVAFQLVASALYAAAAIGFARRAGRTADQVMAWFGTGAAVQAFAHLNYFLFPSLYSSYVSTGDLLRLAGYLMFAIGAAREIEAYWRSQSEKAVLEERRRIARDLHDGVGQELSYIWTQARRPTEGTGTALLQHIAGAAERAIDESRRAIAALTVPIDQPLDLAVRDIGETFARRNGVRLQFNLEAEVEVPGDTRESLLKILREALSNAVRHAGVDEIRVELSTNGALLLRIEDRGNGFDPASGRGLRQGFGLTSMKERAAVIGADFILDSKLGRGTTIEVKVPWTGSPPS